MTAAGLPAGPAGEPLLAAEGLRVAFGARGRRTEVVRGVSFAVRAGECLAVVGESGSGKSVTARTLLGLAGRGATVTADRLTFDGADLARAGEREWRALRGRRIGLVLQDALVSLDPLRTVGAEIGEVLRLHRTVPRDQVAEETAALLERVGVPDPERRARAYPHQLSGGLRQRALIANALAGRPRLLIADEPTTALDATVQARILDLLAELVAGGIGLLMISHDLAAVARLADRVAVMQAGRIVEEGRTRDVLGDPRHPYTRALLAAVPATHRKGTRLAVAAVGGTPGTAEGCGYAARCALADEQCRTSLHLDVTADVSADVIAGVPADMIAGVTAGGPGDVSSLGSGDAFAGHRTLCRHPGLPLPARDAAPDATPDAAPDAVPPRPTGADVPAVAGHVPDAPAPALVEVSGVSRTFHTADGGVLRAVDDVSLTLRAGETLGVVGESGSGKTTVARIVLGLERPEGGRVLIDGRTWEEGTPAERRERRRRVQTVHQDPLGSFDPRWSVARIVGEAVARDGAGGGRDRRDRGDRRARVAELLDQVGLPAAVSDRRPLELSGGQRQRVAIARALAPRPEVIVCDEPVSALDVSIQAQILDLLAEVQRQERMALLFISHDLGVIHHVSDRLIVMKEGRVVETGRLADVFAAPAHPYTRTLLAAVPRPVPAGRGERDAEAAGRG